MSLQHAFLRRPSLGCRHLRRPISQNNQLTSLEIVQMVLTIDCKNSRNFQCNKTLVVIISHEKFMHKTCFLLYCIWYVTGIEETQLHIAKTKEFGLCKG